MKRICNDLCVTTNPGNIIYQQISGQDRTGRGCTGAKADAQGEAHEGTHI